MLGMDEGSPEFVSSHGGPPLTRLQVAARGGGATATSHDDDAASDENFKHFLDSAIQDGEGEAAEATHLLESLYAGGDTIMDDTTGHKKRTTERRSDDEKEAISALQRDNFTWTVKPGTKKKGNNKEW
jgi:hypothetical protein